MINSVTKKPMIVRNDVKAGPFLIVPVDQVDDVCGILKLNDFRFSVSHDRISVDGRPPMTVINLSRDADAEQVQEVLDKAS